MRKYQIHYEGVRRTIEASNHIAARALGVAWFKSRSESFNGDYLAVVDQDMAGRGKHTGHCQGCSPDETCSRSGTCGWADERSLKLTLMSGKMLPDQDLFALYYGSEPAVQVEPRPESAAWSVEHTNLREFVALCDQLPTLDESLQAMLSNRGVELPGMGKSATFDGEAGTYSDPKCYACPGESVWARIQQEDLDKVFDIHCRRAGDHK